MVHTVQFIEEANDATRGIRSLSELDAARVGDTELELIDIGPLFLLGPGVPFLVYIHPLFSFFISPFSHSLCLADTTTTTRRYGLNCTLPLSVWV